MRQHVKDFVLETLKALGLAGRACKIFEVGSYEVPAAKPEYHVDPLRPAVLALCPGSEYTGVDMRAGPGVDVVEDCETPGTNAFDGQYGRVEVVLCVDTLEHVKRPWLMLRTISDLLRPGGVAIFAVPFAFPIHECPHDYYRFTADGLRALGAQFFRDMVTDQDPPAPDVTPHTATMVAKKFNAFTPDEKTKLAVGAWRTNAALLTTLPQGATLMLSVSSLEAVPMIRRAVMGVLGGETLEARYARLCAEPSDINEHLPTLRTLARESRAMIVELGTRHAVSTTALMAGLEDRSIGDSVGHDRELHFVDVDPRAVGLALATLGPLAGLAKIEGRVDDSVRRAYRWPNLPGEENADLLFVDTLHTYAQLRSELFAWCERLQRDGRIVLHDTTTYGLTGEDGTTPGLKQAIAEFLEARKDYELEAEYVNNNGLTVLRRVHGGGHGR